MSASTTPIPEFRPAGTLDVSAALAPYAGPWNPRLAAHLLRRAGFGGSPQEIQSATDAGLHRAVDGLLRFKPDSLPASPAEDISYGPMDKEKRREAYIATQLWWLNRCLQTPNPLQERMVYFWSNHFTSAIGEKGITARMAVDQNDLFRRYALGDYAALTHEISRDPAMMRYLDTAQDRDQHPNENYARELMELFTLGVGNYTEADIRESARAFTGYALRRPGVFYFNERVHDEGTKTFLGRSGDFNGDDIVDIIMQQPATAKFMARKFLRTFVYDDPEPELVDAVATEFRGRRYDVGGLVSTLLRSNVFYSARAYRSLVKSPLEVVIGGLKLVGATEVRRPALLAMARMDQMPMRPPNVAGWPGGQLWINQGTMVARVNFLNQLVMGSALDVMGLASASPVMGVYQSMDAGAVADRVLFFTLQGDHTPVERHRIMSYLGSDGVGNKVALSVENFDEKVRGAMSLALALPSYQLA